VDLQGRRRDGVAGDGKSRLRTVLRLRDRHDWHTRSRQFIRTQHPWPAAGMATESATIAALETGRIAAGGGK
jgi:hypothetical protein